MICLEYPICGCLLHHRIAHGYSRYGMWPGAVGGWAVWLSYFRALDTSFINDIMFVTLLAVEVDRLVMTSASALKGEGLCPCTRVGECGTLCCVVSVVCRYVLMATAHSCHDLIHNTVFPAATMCPTHSSTAKHLMTL